MPGGGVTILVAIEYIKQSSLPSSKRCSLCTMNAAILIDRSTLLLPWAFIVLLWIDGQEDGWTDGATRRDETWPVGWSVGQSWPPIVMSWSGTHCIDDIVQWVYLWTATIYQQHNRHRHHHDNGNGWQYKSFMSTTAMLGPDIFTCLWVASSVWCFFLFFQNHPVFLMSGCYKYRFNFDRKHLSEMLCKRKYTSDLLAAP